MTPAETRAAAVTLRPMAVAWARSYGLALPDAEDVAQGAIVLLFEKGAIVERDRASAWLRTTVFHRARDVSRRREIPCAQVPEEASDAPSPADTLRSREISAAVRRAMDEVVSSRRRILEGVALEGRSLTDMAREEGIPESTARSRMHEGTADMRGKLECQRAEERRRTGGFSSWLVAWGLLDLRVWARRGLAALGAATVGGALYISATPVETLARTPEERPAMAFEVPSVSQPTTAWAERSQERVTAEVTRPRERHDAGRRFRAERFGSE